MIDVSIKAMDYMLLLACFVYEGVRTCFICHLDHIMRGEESAVALLVSL